jgi:RHS repeat-associated protein
MGVMHENDGWRRKRESWLRESAGRAILYCAGPPRRATSDHHASGAAAWLWNHDPLGNGDPTGAFGYELRFPGQFYDRSTKLYYNYFRDYDPRTGRYIESDPIGLQGGINTYGYVNGNPLSLTDPTGLQASSVCVLGGPANPACDAGIIYDAIAEICIVVAGIYERSRSSTCTCSCQHRDVFTFGGASCQTLREIGVCAGPYKGSRTDTASCQSNARNNALSACQGCLGERRRPQA